MVWQQRVLDAGSYWGYACPYCAAILQRTINGTEEDGLIAHIRMVHPGFAAPTPSG
jgi:hypothetical protein